MNLDERAVEAAARERYAQSLVERAEGRGEPWNGHYVTATTAILAAYFAALDREAQRERIGRALQQMWEAEGIEDVGDTPTPWADLIENDREHWRCWADVALKALGLFIPDTEDDPT